jgi:hypothetical protein
MAAHLRPESAVTFTGYPLPPTLLQQRFQVRRWI